jgi:hypothetical protein
VKPCDKAFSGSRVFREFFHDYRLNEGFNTSDEDYKNDILTVGTNPINPNKTFTWYFQDFKIPKGAGNTGKPPSQTQINNLIKKLCNKPTDVHLKDYEYNFSAKRGKVEKDCKAEAGKQVTLRNTQSYFNKVLQAIGSDFALTIKDELLGVD